MAASAAQAEVTLLDAIEVVMDSLTTAFDTPITNIGSVESNYNGDYAEIITAANAQHRAALMSSIQNYKLALIQALKEYGEASGVDIPFDAASREWFVRFREYLQDDGAYTGGSVDKDVTALGWTRGSEPSLTGFKIYRLTVDEYGQDIETGYGQTILLKSITGPGQDVKEVQIEGQDKAIDLYDEHTNGKGSGEVNTLRSVDENNKGDSVITNPTLFSSVADAATITALSGWTLSGTWKNETGSPLLRDQDNVIYSTTDGDYIEQNASSEMNPRIPHIPVVWVYVDGINSGDGFVVNWGGKSQAFTGIADATWTALVPDRDLDLFPTQFDDATNGKRIRVTVDNDNAAGTFYIGAVHWVPMSRWDATWYGVFTDTTNPIAGSVATIADSISFAGKIQECLRLMFYVLGGNEEAYLPTTGTNLISDP